MSLSDHPDIKAFLDLVQAEYGGTRHHNYNENIDTHEQRKGQAFMNALRGTPYYDQLKSTNLDPFYTDNVGAILAAIDHVTRK